MKMKIAWFSPRVPAHSDIANYTQRLEAELRHRFDVRFFAENAEGFCEPATGETYPAELGGTPHALLRALSEVDAPIYNLGNNPAFFAKTWCLSQIKPGLVILHDLKLHHFFEGIYRERLGDQAQYLAHLHEAYGEIGVEAGQRYWQQELSIDFMAEHFPMTAWGVRNALGVIVHTAHALEAVRRETRAPVALNALPYDAHVSPSEARGAGSERRRGEFSPEQPARLVIFGYLNVNRRVVEFFEAMAAMEERACFAVHLFGELWQQYDRDVREAVARLGLQERVIFHGYVPEEELDAGLAQSDLAINLRFPTMGEASGSLLRIWDHALPCLVTRTGGYAALPEEVVGFVRPEHEAVDIRRHLRHFLENPGAGRLRGEKGRQLLLQQHRPSTYVERLGTLCERLPEWRARHNRFAMASRVAELITPWSAASPTVPGDAGFAACIADAF